MNLRIGGAKQIAEKLPQPVNSEDFGRCGGLTWVLNGVWHAFHLNLEPPPSPVVMSLSALRAPLRNARVANPLRRAAPLPKAQFRSTFARKYSTTPPPPAGEAAKSSTGLYLGLGGVAAAGIAYYFFATDSGKETGTSVKSGVQSAKVAANFVPTKEDYIKVIFFFISRRCKT